MTSIERQTLERQVAQLFMVGYAGAEPGETTRRFIELGVGGLIFFRDNFESLQPLTSVKVAETIYSLWKSWPEQSPLPLMGIDQEGGQVERLPHRVFPSGINPLAVGMRPDKEALARDLYGTIAENLALLGLNLNFFPTLDVNLNPANPIIGVRAFGTDPENVWGLGKIAIEAHQAQGVIPVIKHFPGHGNGTVDSHLDLPVLEFTETEFGPFRRAIQASCPAVLVSHGFYPALQSEKQPSSMAPEIVEKLLREDCGFDGVVITDDMCMGAITKYYGPEEAAIRALEAGVDILLYKQSTEAEWSVLNAVVSAFESGRLPISRLEASRARIQHLKSKMTSYQPDFDKIAEALAPECVQAKATQWAKSGISVFKGESRKLQAPVLLIHPQRMGNYGLDIPSSPALPDYFPASTITSMYSHQAASVDVESLPEAVQTLIFVGFNPQIHESQITLLSDLRNRYPEAFLVTVAMGMPNPPEIRNQSHLDVMLGSYRPASMMALADWLFGAR